MDGSGAAGLTTAEKQIRKLKLGPLLDGVSPGNSIFQAQQKLEELEDPGCTEASAIEQSIALKHHIALANAAKDSFTCTIKRELQIEGLSCFWSLDTSCQFVLCVGNQQSEIWVKFSVFFHTTFDVKCW